MIRAGQMAAGPGEDPAKGRLVPGPHGPEQGIGLGLGNGGTATFGDDHAAFRGDELLPVALPGGGQDPSQIRRPTFAAGRQGQERQQG